MSSSRKYKKPPITEAIINFGFGEPIDAGTIAKFKSKLSNEYPLSTDWKETTIAVNPGTRATTFQDAVTGYRLSSLDQADVFIAGDTRYAVARLAPYTGWEHLRDRARRGWDLLRILTEYRKIVQIGVRFINRVDIPVEQIAKDAQGESFVRTEDFFQFYLDIKQPPFPPLASHMMQAVFPLDDGKVVVNSGSVPSPLLNHFSYALDIDVVRDRNVPQSDKQIWTYVDSVREQKNQLFEASITDRSRALFDK